MKYLVLLWSLVCFACATTSSPESRNEPFATTNVSTEALSEYQIWNGVVVHDNPVIQSSVTTTFRNGVQLNLWHSAGLDDADLSSDFGDELNYTVGWRGVVMDDVDLALGVSYFDLFELGEGREGGIDVIRPYVQAGQEKKLKGGHSFGHATRVEGRMRASGDSDANASIIFGLTHRYEQLLIGIEQKASLVNDFGSIGFEGIVLGRYDFDLLYHLGAGVTWNVLSLTATTPLSEAENGQETNAIVGMGLRVSL